VVSASIRTRRVHGGTPDLLPKMDNPMKASGPKSLPAIGFLTVLEHQPHGLFGGYLILNAASRPLEFHCTAPVKPNRAQQILYGPTLDGFLYGEQIGRTLLKKSKMEPLIVCTDVEPVLAVRDHVSVPTILVFPPSTEGTHDETSRSAASSALSLFKLGEFEVAVPEQYAEDREAVLQHWEPYQHRLDLLEPFDRIREAVQEAQKAA